MYGEVVNTHIVIHTRKTPRLRIEAFLKPLHNHLRNFPVVSV